MAHLLRQPPLMAPVGVDGVDVVREVGQAQEDDRPPVRRPGGRTGHFGRPGRVPEKVEQATADAERRRCEQPPDQDHDGNGDYSPAPESRWKPPRLDVRAEERTLPLERIPGERELVGDPGHFSAIPSSPISICLCPGAPSSSTSAARARERRERTVPTGTSSATAASSYRRPDQTQRAITSCWALGKRAMRFSTERISTVASARSAASSCPVGAGLVRQLRDQAAVTPERTTPIAQHVRRDPVEPGQELPLDDDDLPAAPERLEKDNRGEVLRLRPIGQAAEEVVVDRAGVALVELRERILVAACARL